MNSTLRSYSELSKYRTFLERFNYLKLNDHHIGDDVFGFNRYMNQKFYRSQEWRKIRDYVIMRDNGCDLGMRGREIYSQIIIHHMNPISKEDIINATDLLLDPEYLICVSDSTHRAIHWSDESLLESSEPVNRFEYDTIPWR